MPFFFLRNTCRPCPEPEAPTRTGIHPLFGRAEYACGVQAGLPAHPTTPGLPGTGSSGARWRVAWRGSRRRVRSRFTRDSLSSSRSRFAGQPTALYAPTRTPERYNHKPGAPSLSTPGHAPPGAGALYRRRPAVVRMPCPDLSCSAELNEARLIHALFLYTVRHGARCASPWCSDSGPAYLTRGIPQRRRMNALAGRDGPRPYRP